MIYDMATTNKNEILTQVTPSFLRKSLHCSVRNLSFQEVIKFLLCDSNTYIYSKITEAQHIVK